MENKIDKIIDTMTFLSKLDKNAYEYLNYKIYDKLISPLVTKVSDLSFLLLVNYTHEELNQMFTTPGVSENEKRNKVVLWDEKKGGFPPEQLDSILLNLHEYKKENAKKEIKYYIDQIEKGLSRLKKQKEQN